MAEKGLNPNNWLITKNVSGQVHLVNRTSGKQRIVTAG
ncbi:DUF6906 family protein [Fictibacillus aquaticus]